MEHVFAGLSTEMLALALLISCLAGFVKGAVGFAMPMIMISGLSTFLPVETALALLILPTLLTNGAQALRQGRTAAWQTICRFRGFLVAGFFFLVIGAQLVPLMPENALFLAIGVPVTIFAVILLSGVRFHVPLERRGVTEIGVGAFAGAVGGMSGVWGPPTVTYLTAIDLPKKEHVRAQGVIYGLGALALLGAHVNTGIVSADILPLSMLMLVPASVGMVLGFKLNDKLNQSLFRRATLVVLIIAGLNLVRRAVM